MSHLWPPTVGICGWKDSGKTTLIEALIPRCRARGWRVGVIKHDAHGLEVDRPGKDTARYFAAGAEVVAHDPHQWFARRHLTEAVDLDALAAHLGETCDLVLVEGHKASPVAKLWILEADETPVPAEARHVIAALRRSDRLVDEAYEALVRAVDAHHQGLRTFAGVLIGGSSTRMGQPKALLPCHHRTLIEHLVDVVRPWVADVMLLGSGPTPPSFAEMPRVADVPGFEGPMGGILAALRWAPRVRWLILPCDLPLVSNDDLLWLLRQAVPGRPVTMPRLPSKALPEPLCALYDPPARQWLEAAAARGEFSLRHAFPPEAVAVPDVPLEHAACWTNVNSPDDWHRLQQSCAGGTGPHP